jgi:hypothetical protein
MIPVNETLAPAGVSAPPNDSAWILPANSLTVLYGLPDMGRLAHFFLPRALLAGSQVLYLDGANGFDPLMIARFARKRGLPPSEFNRRVRVARAFTCFQLTELLLRAPGFLDRFSADVLIVTALPDLYFDEDVREREAATAFERALEGLRRLAHPQLAIGVFSDALSFHTPRRKFFQKLTAQADAVLKIETQADNHLTIQSVRETSRLAS